MVATGVSMPWCSAETHPSRDTMSDARPEGGTRGGFMPLHRSPNS